MESAWYIYFFSSSSSFFNIFFLGCALLSDADPNRCFTFDNVLGSSLNLVKVSRFICTYTICGKRGVYMRMRCEWKCNTIKRKRTERQAACVNTTSRSAHNEYMYIKQVVYRHRRINCVHMTDSVPMYCRFTLHYLSVCDRLCWLFDTVSGPAPNTYRSHIKSMVNINNAAFVVNFIDHLFHSIIVTIG